MELIYILGFTGQAFFGARTIAQWVYSEREGRVVSPTIFWVFSVMGASIFLVYGLIREDLVIMIGQTISFYIYLRNLQLKGVWARIPLLARLLIVLIPPALLIAFTRFADLSIGRLLVATDYTFFFVVGIIGQLLLNFRYFYQWIVSERLKESVLPLGFWVISAVASIMVIAYSAQRGDPVLFVAQAGGLIAYLRNIYLHFRSRQSNG